MNSIKNNVPVFYRRHLPHFQPGLGSYFITFRLKNSLPQNVIEKLNANLKNNLEQIGNALQKDVDEIYIKYFEQFENELNCNRTGPFWLRDSRLAQIVMDAILYYDCKNYNLLSCCIMPNHVHLLFELIRDDIQIFKILQSIKRFTARKCNFILERSGAFWQDESFDHFVRNEEDLYRFIWYILENPVKAGFVQAWKDWQWTYVKPGLLVRQ